MAKTINTNIVNNTSEGYLIDAKNIKGGYFSVEGNPNNITDASKIPTDIKTAGSLCYDATNKKYYRYNPSSNKWEEEKLGSVEIPDATDTVKGITLVYPAASCTTYTSDSGTCTPAAVKKAVTTFGVTDIVSGSNAGTIKFTKNGTASEVKVKGLLGAAYKNVDTSVSLGSTSTNLPTSKAVADLVSSAISSSGGSGNDSSYIHWTGNLRYLQGFICVQIGEIAIHGTTDARILHSSGPEFSNASAVFLQNTWYLDAFSAMVPYTYGATTDLDPLTSAYNPQVILPFTTTVYSSETYETEMTGTQPSYVGTVTGTIRYGYDKMPDMWYGIDLRDLTFNLKNASNGDTGVMSYATIAYNKIVNLNEDQYAVYCAG